MNISFALGEALLALSDHLFVLHVPWHCFQKDLFHDLAKHRSEAHQSVLPQVLLSTPFKNGVMFPFFQSPGTSLNCYIQAGLVISRILEVFHLRNLLSLIPKAIYQSDTGQKFDRVESSGDIAISTLAGFWHHTHGLQQQLSVSPIKDHSLWRRKN